MSSLALSFITSPLAPCPVRIVPFRQDQHGQRPAGVITRGRKDGTIGGCQKSQRTLRTMRGRNRSNRPQRLIMHRLPRSTRYRLAEATKFRLTMRAVLRLQLRRVDSPITRNRRKANHPLGLKKPPDVVPGEHIGAVPDQQVDDDRGHRNGDSERERPLLDGLPSLCLRFHRQAGTASTSRDDSASAVFSAGLPLTDS